MKYSQFHIHGDNIVECERTIGLIHGALGGTLRLTWGASHNPACPSFEVVPAIGGQSLTFTCFPGFGRWDQDILQHIRELGGTLREAADVILTGVTAAGESPLLAVEYCGALPAGNQAWQRCGRAYSLGLASVPFLYVAELGGYELDAHRARKAPRLPNPAVPFSFICHSVACSTPVLPVFTASPGAGDASRQLYNSIFGDQELATVMRAVVLGVDYSPAVGSLKEKVINFVRVRASSSREQCTLSSDQWTQAYASVSRGLSLSDFLFSQEPIDWSKTAYIKGLTSTARSLMDLAAEHAIGLTSSDLPMCLFAGDDRPAFTRQVSALYRNLPGKFVEWLGSTRPLAVCWVMGFKPRGDDARPDRGLSPMTRMLIGPNHDLLTVVYGPAPAATWPLLMQNPATLMEQNGLWEAILEPSSALLVDSSTDRVTQHGFLREHWADQLRSRQQRPIRVTPKPLRYGEQDVDTALHLLLSRVGSDRGVFEGMCNPPGGDWSGISLLTSDGSTELRWMSLPRVGGGHAKRPDHVFQIFGIDPKPVVLIVESKETATAVESSIGPMLKTYVSDLLSTSASTDRTLSPRGRWSHSERSIATGDLLLCSGVAFLGEPEGAFDALASRTKADVLFLFTISPDGERFTLRIDGRTTLGRKVARFIESLPLDSVGIIVARS